MAALDLSRNGTYQLTYENILWIYAEFHAEKYEFQPGKCLQGPMAYMYAYVHTWMCIYGCSLTYSVHDCNWP